MRGKMVRISAELECEIEKMRRTKYLKNNVEASRMIAKKLKEIRWDDTY